MMSSSSSSYDGVDPRSQFSAAHVAPLTTMASAMWFGTILFTTIALHVRSIAHGNYRHWAAAHNPRSSELDVRSFCSVYTALHHFSVLGLILFYAYLCEYHPPYAHSEKSYNRDEFFFLTALLLLLSYFTLQSNVEHDAAAPPASSDKAVVATGKTNETQNSATETLAPPSPTAAVVAVAPVDDNTEVLNRDQTEEWKGWMQFMFLLYHYYHAEEVYNAIRVMITSYVWMTGFGNFSFFYLKADYGAVRVLQMLWRLNFLVVFLCLTQGTTYILYYICLLHTYYFLMVYVTMRTAHSINYTWALRHKLLVVAIIIYVVWDLDLGLFSLLHGLFLGSRPMLGATSGSLWEWYFRSSLDHWSTFFGMTFALNFPITSLFFRKLEAQPLWRHVAAKAAVGSVLLAALVWWTTGPFTQGKFDYNQTNSYFAFIPVLAYIYFRNLTPWLRSHALDLLHQIGKTTLETYLMQHHIWLTSDAKTLLTLIPGWPKMNFLLVSIIYVLASRRLYALTLFLRGMMLPNDYQRCVRNAALLFGSIAVTLALAGLLKLLGILNLITVGMVSLLGGYGLYESVVAKTWTTYHETSGSAQDVAASASLPSLRRLSTMAGSVGIVCLGIGWHHASRVGAAKIRPLPAMCAAAVQDGAWVSIDACNEDSRGSSYRDSNIGAFGTCSPQSNIYTWGWKAAPSKSHCRFAQRDKKSLSNTLKYRNVTFAGDSIIRHLYHAMCRQVGDRNAGAYNTTLEKWSDYSQSYGTATLEFRWSPYTDWLTDTIRKIRYDREMGFPHPDVVIAGGGPWDRLHRYNTTAARQELHDQISTLSTEFAALEESGVVTVWVVPTTINTWALLTADKKENIREDQIQELRNLYKSSGISGSFVLDGTSFTAQRVAESYDGVHYPLSVYDGGAQILANAFDWLLPTREIPNNFKAPRPGAMAHPLLGLVMLIFIAMALYTCDGFLGISYVAGLFVPSATPSASYEEAFTDLHLRKKLPAIEIRTASATLLATNGSQPSPPAPIKSKASDYHLKDYESDLDEMASFLGNSDDIEDTQSEASLKDV